MRSSCVVGLLLCLCNCDLPRLKLCLGGLIFDADLSLIGALSINSKSFVLCRFLLFLRLIMFYGPSIRSKLFDCSDSLSLSIRILWCLKMREPIATCDLRPSNYVDGFCFIELRRISGRLVSEFTKLSFSGDNLARSSSSLILSLESFVLFSSVSCCLT